MLENALFALVRSTLLAGFAARGPEWSGILVQQTYQPLTVGMPSPPVVTMESIANRRYGAMRRTDIPQPAPAVDLIHEEKQWWETTIQIGATVQRNPENPDWETLPSSTDICKAASNILQGDAGLAALRVQNVAPLRITDVRGLKFVNDSDEYQAMPNFDVVLVYPEVSSSITPPVESFDPVTGRV